MSLTSSYNQNRAFKPIRSYSPTRGLTTVTTERKAYQQLPPAGASSGRARSNAYYRAPTGIRRDGSSSPPPTPTRRNVSSYSSSGVTSYKYPSVDNGLGKCKISVDYELNNNYMPSQKACFTDLRARTKTARDQLSHHRVLLDRYLPINMGPTDDVEYEVENKYGELVHRMPQLEYNHRSKNRYEDEDDSRPSRIAPYQPAPTRGVKPEPLAYLPPVRNSFTPKISDTRKRARSVLCKIKGDPRYFDFS
jgi:hypothetical protein